MARTVRDAKLETRSARLRLVPRKEPHWRLISEGAHLGYYKGARSGSWVARFRPDRGSYTKITLGRADDVDDADGLTVLDFKQAQDKARVWFQDQQRQLAPAASAFEPDMTIATAVRSYLNEFRRRGGKSVKDAELRASALILPVLGSRLVRSLTTKEIRDWHQELAETPARIRSRAGTQQRFKELDMGMNAVRRRRATANRTLTILKAALNFAHREGLVESDEAWRRVKPFRQADAPKIHYLSAAECRGLVEACAADFRPLVEAALLTGCRYGELIAMTCRDFDASAGSIHVRASKSGKGRHVVLSADGVAFFRTATADHGADALIFTKPNGRAWGQSHQHRPILEASRRAEIVPPATFHVLRHSYASHLVMAGVPLPVIAANLGHADTRMTERHYAHLSRSYVADTIRAAMLNLEFVRPTLRTQTG